MHNTGITGTSGNINLAQAAHMAATQASSSSARRVLSSDQLITQLNNWAGSDLGRRQVFDLLAPFIRFTPHHGRLVLSGSSTDELPQQLGDVPGVKTLVLDDMPNVTRLPDDLGRLSGLEALSLSRMDGIAELPETIDQLRNVQHLSVNGLSLSALPAAVGGMERLERLTLSNLPGVSELPPELNRCERLSEVMLSSMPNLQGLGSAITQSVNNLNLHRMPIQLAVEAHATQAARPQMHVEVSESMDAFTSQLVAQAQTRVRAELGTEATPERAAVDHLLEVVATSVLCAIRDAARIDEDVLPAILSVGINDALHTLQAEQDAAEEAERLPHTADISINIVPASDTSLTMGSAEYPGRSNVSGDQSASAATTSRLLAPPTTPQSRLAHTPVRLFQTPSPRQLHFSATLHVPAQMPTHAVDTSLSHESHYPFYERTLARVAAQLLPYNEAAQTIFSEPEEEVGEALLNPETDDFQVDGDTSALQRDLFDWGRVNRDRLEIANEVSNYVGRPTPDHQMILENMQTDEIPPHIGTLDLLTDLTIARMPNLTRLPATMAQMQNMRDLTLIELPVISADDWQIIGQMSGLQSLVIEDCGVSAATIPTNLSALLPNLRACAITSTDTGAVPARSHLQNFPAGLLRLDAEVNLTGHRMEAAMVTMATEAIERARAGNFLCPQLTLHDGLNSEERDFSYRARTMVRNAWERMGGIADRSGLEVLQRLVAQHVIEAIEDSDPQADREAVMARGIDDLLNSLEQQNAELHAESESHAVEHRAAPIPMVELEEEEDDAQVALEAPHAPRHAQAAVANSESAFLGFDGFAGLASNPNEPIDGLPILDSSLLGIAEYDSDVESNVRQAGRAPSEAAVSSSSSTGNAAVGASAAHDLSFEAVLNELLRHLPDPQQADFAFHDSNADVAWQADLNAGAEQDEAAADMEDEDQEPRSENADSFAHYGGPFGHEVDNAIAPPPPQAAESDNDDMSARSDAG